MVGKIIRKHGYVAKVFDNGYLIFKDEGEDDSFYEEKVIPKRPIWRGKGGEASAKQSIVFANNFL